MVMSDELLSSGIPKFAFEDLASYLVGEDEYSVENLWSFKSLNEYKLAALRRNFNKLRAVYQ